MMKQWLIFWTILLASTAALAAGYEMDLNGLFSARSDAREEADLVAQQEMARWAAPMFIATAFSVALSLGALVGLFFSLRQTGQAVMDNRELGEAAVRAYVQAGSVQFSKDGKALLVTFVNMGQTPVVSFRAAIELSQVAENAVSENIFILSSVPMKSFDGIGCGSQSNRTVRIEPRKGEETISVFTRNSVPKRQFCLVNGRIDYQDVFGFTWTTGFAYFLDDGKFVVPFHTLPTYQSALKIDEMIGGDTRRENSIV